MKPIYLSQHFWIQGPTPGRWALAEKALRLSDQDNSLTGFQQAFHPKSFIPGTRPDSMLGK